MYLSGSLESDRFLYLMAILVDHKVEDVLSQLIPLHILRYICIPGCESVNIPTTFTVLGDACI
jgi:hypothetical protein